MAQLNREQLQFCFDELLGELGWGDELAETGVDPLNWARDEIKSLHKQIERLRGLKVGFVPCAICGKSEGDHYTFALIHAYKPTNVCRVIEHVYIDGICVQCGEKQSV